MMRKKEKNINGKKNKKGEEYENSKLNLEVEYLNSVRNKKEKEYYDNAKLNLEAEYLKKII